jgi:UDPglucose 6-dehydrogenase
MGVGYMGIATALAFSHRGRQVFAYDVNPRVRASLRSGRSPYREQGLEELLRAESRRARFVVVDTVAELVKSAECIFLCLPTPAGRGGRINLAPLRAGVGELGRALRPVRGYRLVVVKSTVVPGTTDVLVDPILRRTSGKGPESLGLATNPEFLSEGRMVQDALFPERIVLGATDARCFRVLAAVYRGFPAARRELSPAEAELVKYASNTFLALKVSFANEISRWTELLGGSVDDVVGALGADRRIGPSFLKAGPGFGGSCFEKDLRAFVGRAGELGIRARAAEATLAINREQTEHVSELISRAAGRLRGKTVAVLGVAFKAGTDDVRESRAFPIVEQLLRAGSRVRVHDPAALANFRREWGRRAGAPSGSLKFSSSVVSCLRGADLAVLQAEWPEYVDWPARWSEVMRTPKVVDLRRALPPSTIERAGLKVVPLGVGGYGRRSPLTPLKAAHVRRP